MTARLFTQSQLDRLAMPFRSLLADVIGDARSIENHVEDAAIAVDLVGDANAAYRSGIQGFQIWSASILAWVNEEHGPKALASFAEVTTSSIAWCQRKRPPQRGSINEVQEYLTTRNFAAALNAFDRMEAEHRYLHDVALDWVCVLLSEVHRQFGAEGLETSLRRTGDETLLAWMPRDVVKEPKARLERWTRLLKGNFASLSLSEDDEKFIITQDPCGSCGRQLAECEYPGPLDLELVSEAANLTKGGRLTTVYRTHAVLMHHVVPMERIGVPWPVVLCPDGVEATPCQILLFKDPGNPKAADIGRGAHPADI